MAVWTVVNAPEWDGPTHDTDAWRGVIGRVDQPAMPRQYVEESEIADHGMA